MTAIDATLDLAKWYAQEHVVLCLLPAFLIAGVIAVFVSQGAVLKYFGANAKKWLSYTIAAISGGILAVCSCTILPLFTSIYKRGAGLGPPLLSSIPAGDQYFINYPNGSHLGRGDGYCPYRRSHHIFHYHRSSHVIHFPQGRKSQKRGTNEHHPTTGETPDVANFISLFHDGTHPCLRQLGSPCRI